MSYPTSTVSQLTNYTMTTSVTEINKAIQIIKECQAKLEAINSDYIDTVSISDFCEHMDDIIADLESELSDYLDGDVGPEYDGAGFTEQDRIVNGQYQNRQTKQDDDDFIDPAGGRGLHSHV